MQQVGVRDEVVSLRQQHPEWTLEKIGDETGVSRQRVHQLLKSLVFPTAHKVESPRCAACGEVMETRNRKYHPKCYDNKFSVNVVCGACHLTKTISRRDYNKCQKIGQTRFFCDRRCYSAHRRGQTVQNSLGD